MMPTVSITRQQVMDLEKTIARTITEGKKSVSGAMIQASTFASQSAALSSYGATKGGGNRRMGAKNRKSRRHKRRAYNKGGSKASNLLPTPWWSIGSVDIWTKGDLTQQHFRTEKTFQSARAVPRRGLAGNVWRATSAKKIRAVTKDATIMHRFASTNVTQSDGFISRIVMANSLSYIQKIAPQSAQDAIAKTNKKMEGILRKGLARKIEKAFQKRQGN